jgi:hypothetical protein
MGRARSAEDRGDYALAFAELERAHILGQRWLFRHLRSHWGMLRIALKTRDHREVWGQITRLIGSPLFWLVGWLPKGNSGGANVSPVKPMPLQGDLAVELAGYNVWRDVAMRFALAALALFVFLVFLR